MNSEFGHIYLIPTTLGDNEPLEVLPLSVKQTIEQLSVFIVENEKSARRFIKRLTPRKSQSSLQLFTLNKYTTDEERRDYLKHCLSGIHVGLISEAGVPAVADPGSSLIKYAHELGIRVIPMVGPSSIIMAMMASGLNGQNFAFNGYLPIDRQERKQSIKQLEKHSKNFNQSQIFIETPYRNEKLLDAFLQVLTPNTFLCIAIDISLPGEFIQTKTVSEWKHNKPDLHKRPAIFIIHKL